jgi:dihydrolipoamide dehydrogenase
MDIFDLIVIGSGPGGYVCAIRAAQLGLKTALVEKDAALGGTCLNVGCIPSKALLESSELFHVMRHKAEPHGISPSSVKLDLPRMLARKEGIVKDLTDGIAVLMKKNKVTVVRGRGVLKGGGKVAVLSESGEQEIEAKAIGLAMGSVAVELPFLPFDGDKVVSSTEALCFDKVPQHLVVIGAGAIGLEMGSVWNRLAAKVTVVELLPRVAPFADSQMSTFLERSLKAQGMIFRLGAKVTGAKPEGEGLSVTIQNAKGEEESFTCDKILVAVGRKPCTDTAGLQEAGVIIEGGRVQVDDHFRTNLPGVFAIGDLIRGPMLAHKAQDEGVALAELLAGKPGHVNYDAIPNVVYTHPELACVGLTEEECKAKGLPVKVGKFYFKGNGRAKSLGEDEGLVKVVAHAETDRLLGVHILGARASDMIAEAVVAMEMHASAEDLARTCHAHPTLSEILKEAALNVEKRAIHG